MLGSEGCCEVGTGLGRALLEGIGVIWKVQSPLGLEALGKGLRNRLQAMILGLC